MVQALQEESTRKKDADGARAIRLLNWRQVALRINRGRSWIFAAVRAGNFPAPLDIPDLPGRCLWEEATIQRWLEERIAQARARADRDSAEAR